MALLDAIFKGIVQRAFPGSRNPDLQEARARLGGNGEQCIIPYQLADVAVADEGQYFYASNPTPGTSISGSVTSVTSETAGYFFSIQNTEPAGGKRAYLKYMRILCNVVPASAVAADMFIKLDTVGWTSGGTAIVPVNVNGDSNNKSVCNIQAGALTTAARSASPRLVYRSRMRTAIPVAGDEWFFTFGSGDTPATYPIGGTTAQRMPITGPPVIIGPGQFGLVQMYYGGNAATAPSFEFEICYIER